MSYTVDKTVSYTGGQCEWWSLSTEHYYAEFPDASLADCKNYCRNPNNEHPEGPWCLVLDAANNFVHEFCDVLLCSTAGWCQNFPFWRHNMETASKLLALCDENPSVIGWFSSQGGSNAAFHVFFVVTHNNL